MGIRTGIEYLTMYPKNEGIFTRDCSAIDFTMKLGPFPIYVFAPNMTAPAEIASTYRHDAGVSATAPALRWAAQAPISRAGRRPSRAFTWVRLSTLRPWSPHARLKKLRYVGALSKKLDSVPAAQ